MRALRILFPLATIGLLVALPAAADHAQTVQGRYVMTSLVGIDDTPLGFEWCITRQVSDDALGCLGGGEFHTHPVGTLNTQGADCGGEPDLCHTYMRAAATAIDAISGPNIYLFHCMPHPDTTVFCGGGEGEANDGVADVFVTGCGQTLEVDAADVDGHPGNHHTIVFAFTVHVETATNEVCIGTSGNIPIVFS